MFHPGSLDGYLSTMILTKLTTFSTDGLSGERLYIVKLHRESIADASTYVGRRLSLLLLTLSQSGS